MNCFIKNVAKFRLSLSLGFKPFYRRGLVFTYLLLSGLAVAQDETADQVRQDRSVQNQTLLQPSSPLINFEGGIWTKMGPNLYFGKISVGKYNPLFESLLYLIRFRLDDYQLNVAVAENLLNKKTSSVKELVDKSGGIAGINANFFDTDSKPLGLIITENKERLNTLHKGGKLLTGIFLIKNNLPYIVHRSDFSSEDVSLAVQAGPRIITSKKLVSFTGNDPYSRRSGVAITKDNEIIFYATALRFPGASMTDIQQALLNIGVQVTDALNFDGGGSSQFYLNVDSSSQNINISGGDDVPVALVLKKI